MMLLASSLVSYAPAVPTIGSRVAAVQMHYNHDQEDFRERRSRRSVYQDVQPTYAPPPQRPMQTPPPQQRQPAPAPQQSGQQQPMGVEAAPVYFDHNLENFRERKSTYSSVFSQSQPRPQAQIRAQARAQAARARQAPMPQPPPPGGGPGFDMSPPLGVEQNPVYYDHDQENFREKSVYASVFSNNMQPRGRVQRTPPPPQPRPAPQPQAAPQAAPQDRRADWPKSLAAPPPPAPQPQATPQPQAARQPQAAPQGDQGIGELALWLEQTISVPPADAFACATVLFSDGCRCKDDVFMLVEADALNADIPVVMRLKLKRAAASTGSFSANLLSKVL